MDLAGGYKSVGIPSLFPSDDRAWTKPDDGRMKQQAAVAASIVAKVWERSCQD